MKQLDGRVAVVTGGGRRIRRAPGRGLLRGASRAGGAGDEPRRGRPGGRRVTQVGAGACGRGLGGGVGGGGGGGGGGGLLATGLLGTGLWTADRNRPAGLARERPRSRPAISIEHFEKIMHERGADVTFQPLDEVARWVVDAVRADQFWILPPALYDDDVRQRAQALIDRPSPFVHKAVT